MKILAVIPARGGSKGIPRKNVRLLAGIPLIGYAINTVSKSKFINDIVITTDDDEIERAASLYNVEVVRRPVDLGFDDVSLDPVIYHALNTIYNDNIKNTNLL